MRLFDPSPCRRCRLLGVLAFACLLAPALRAQVPVAHLDSVFPLGVAPGQEIEVRVRGAHLETDRPAEAALLFSHPGLSGRPKTKVDPLLGERVEPGVFLVRAAADVPPGIYDVRAAGLYGASNPRSFAVGRATETLETEPNNAAESAQEIQLPASVSGKSQAAKDLDWYRFRAPAGATLIATLDGERLDTRFDPVVVLFGPEGRELERGRRSPRVDALLVAELPVEGEYRLRVHDMLFRGSEDHGYRLTVHTGPRVEQVFPPAVLPGGEVELEVFGWNLPGGQASSYLVAGRPLEVVRRKLAVPARDALGPSSALRSAPSYGATSFDYRLELEGARSNPVPLSLAEAPPQAEKSGEKEADDEPLLTLPFEYHGRFYPRGDTDAVRVELAKGQSVHIEVSSHRSGYATDAYLLVEQLKEGAPPKVLKRVDDDGTRPGDHFDAASGDPSLDFTAPEAGVYRLRLRDLHGAARGDPRFAYRLIVRPLAPDFRLVASTRAPRLEADEKKNLSRPSSILVRRSGAASVEIWLQRREGFQGPVRVEAKGLPAGVAASPVVFQPGQDRRSLIFHAGDEVADWRGKVRIVGKAKIGENEVARAARIGSLTFSASGDRTARTRLAASLVVAVKAEEKAPFLVAAPEPLSAPRASKLELTLAVARGMKQKGELQLLPKEVPPGVKVGSIKINDKTGEAKLPIEITDKAPIGKFTFHFDLRGQVEYRRGEAAAVAAEAQRVELAKVHAERAASHAALEKERAAIEQSLTTTTESLTAAEAELAQLRGGLVELGVAGGANSEEQKRRVEETVGAFERAVEAKVRAAVAAAQAKRKIDEHQSALARLATTLAAAKSALDTQTARAKTLAEAAKPKDRKVYTCSLPVRLAITERAPEEKKK